MKDLINFEPDDGEQKKQFNKLKHDLEEWREVIVYGTSVLRWDQPIYPGITCGFVTLLFIFFWWLDMSILTQFSLLLLFICLVDYASPYVLKFVFKPEKWTGAQEKEYEGICREIFNFKLRVTELWTKIRNAKQEKSTSFIVLVSSVLLILAWLGSSMNNMFLTYVLTLLAFNYPGLSKHGITDQVKGLVAPYLKSVMKKTE